MRRRRRHKSGSTSTRREVVEMVGDLPDNFSWRHTKNLMLPIRHQKDGSCWALGASELVSYRYRCQFPKSKFDPSITQASAQYLIDFFPEDRLVIHPYHGLQFIQLEGVPIELNHPYLGKKSHIPKSDINMWPKFLLDASYCFEESTPLEVIKEAIMVSPVAGTLFSGPSFQQWRPSSEDAIYNGPNEAHNHAVIIVGFGTTDGIDYYEIKNSYGIEWGSGGYARVARDLIQPTAYPGYTRLAWTPDEV